MLERAEHYAFILSPGESESLHVRFEPIGPEYDISPGDHLRVSVSCPSDDPVEVTAGGNWVAIWGAPSATIRATNSSGVDLPFLT